MLTVRNVAMFVLFQLLQELDGHFSVINALCFDEDGMQLYSGDSLGNIISWNVFVTDKQSSKGNI